MTQSHSPGAQSVKPATWLSFENLMALAVIAMAFANYYFSRSTIVTFALMDMAIGGLTLTNLKYRAHTFSTETKLLFVFTVGIVGVLAGFAAKWMFSTAI